MPLMGLQPPETPIIVQIIEEPVRETTVVDVLLGALGLTGVLLLTAAILGAAFGALLILYRVIRARRTPYTGEAGDPPHIV